MIPIFIVLYVFSVILSFKGFVYYLITPPQSSNVRVTDCIALGLVALFPVLNVITCGIFLLHQFFIAQVPFDWNKVVFNKKEGLTK